MDRGGYGSISEHGDDVKEGAAEAGFINSPVKSAKGRVGLEHLPHAVQVVITEVPKAKNVVDEASVE